MSPLMVVGTGIFAVACAVAALALDIARHKAGVPTKSEPNTFGVWLS